jgi:hypothetical protein
MESVSAHSAAPASKPQRQRWAVVIGAAAIAFVVWVMYFGRPPSARLPDGSELSIVDVRAGTAFPAYPHGLVEQLRSLAPGPLARRLGLGSVNQVSFGERLSSGLLVTVKTRLPTAGPPPYGGTYGALNYDRYRLTLEPADVPGAVGIVAPGFVPESRLDPKTVVGRHFFASVPRSAKDLMVRVYRMDDTQLTTPLHAFRISNPLGPEPPVPPRDPAPPVQVSVHQARWTRMKGIPPNFMEETRVGFSVGSVGTNAGVWIPTRVVELADALGNRQVLDIPVRPAAPVVPEVRSYEVAFYNEILPGDSPRKLWVEFTKDAAGAGSPTTEPGPASTRRLEVPLSGDGKPPVGRN